MTNRRKIAAVVALSGWAALCVVPLGAARAQAGSGSGVGSSERAKQIGGKFMCMCSCSQVLTQCNHVGCTVSTSMLKQVDQHLASGDSEAAITQAFVQEFGTQVYAEPPKSGLSLVAWSLPTVYLVAGTVLVIVIAMRWRAKTRSHATYPAVPVSISTEDMDRVRRRIAHETED
jgi:cytochrome c-type biogenesis protein CcmH